MHLTILFVRPEKRNQRLATRLLERIMACLEPADLRRLQLETDWCAFRAVPLYLSLGMRVRMWKRDLALVWYSSQPRLSFADDETGARCVVEGTDVITARWRGDRLEWAPTADPEKRDDLYELEGTFALALAARGRVNAPRTPGLAYPTWDELERDAEARYAAKSAAKMR